MPEKYDTKVRSLPTRELFDDFDSRLRAVEGKHSSSGGGNMEERIARLEISVEYIQRDVAEIKTDIRDLRKDLREDFRVLFGALIFVALGFAGVMAKALGWL